MIGISQYWKEEEDGGSQEWEGRIRKRQTKDVESDLLVKLIQRMTQRVNLDSAVATICFQQLRVC